MYWNLIIIVLDKKNVKLNSNIRCIEIHIIYLPIDNEHKLNSNIRCIEIRFDIVPQVFFLCWIVTLDVLKSRDLDGETNLYSLNSNIRCIEMHRHSRLSML